MILFESKYCYNNIHIVNKLFKNYNIVSGSFIGSRVQNNDIIKVDTINNKNIVVLCDGHGGNYLSKKVSNKIIEKFLDNYDFDNKKNIDNLYLETDNYFYKNYYLNNSHREGTTCLVIIIDNGIKIINLGDSNYLLAKNNNYNTGNIHRPNTKDEISRIIQNKDKIIKINKDFRINGRLSLSRSFGDYTYKLVDNNYNGIDSTVSVIPDIYKYSKPFKFIIAGSDGFWDYVKVNDIFLYVKINIRNKKINQIIKYLIKNAIDNGSKDNISVIIIKYCGK
jgi:serine/threonine protein phosphatase PrpC